MLTVTPDPLVVGGNARVCISDSSTTSQTVVVTIDDGEGSSDTLSVSLDQTGSGCADWEVPDWEQAKFNYGSCDEVFRNIVQSPGG